MPEPASTSRRAGRHLASVVVFSLIVLVTLGLDLWFKAWSFRNVADQPLILERDPDDGTTLVQTRDGAGKLFVQPRARENEPASAIPYHEGKVIVPGIFALRLTINTGAVFGLGKGKQWIFVVVSILAVFVISFVFHRSDAKAKWFHITLALILGGALGNMYDRAMFNGVRDMCLLFPGVKLPFGWHWPAFVGGSDEVYPWIFNVADAALVIGVISLFIISWRGDKPKPADPAKPG